jgi:hypothetical protein
LHNFIDHLIAENIKLYAGTEHALAFHIFHDGLTVWWRTPSKKGSKPTLHLQVSQIDKCIV